MELKEIIDETWERWGEGFGCNEDPSIEKELLKSKLILWRNREDKKGNMLLKTCGCGCFAFDKDGKCEMCGKFPQFGSKVKPE